MSVPKELKTRIGEALKELKVSGEKAGNVSVAVDEVAQILQKKIVPLSQSFRSLSGVASRNKSRDIFDQMDRILKVEIGLKTFPELASELVEDESLALLVWGGDLTSTSGGEALPAMFELNVLGKKSMLNNIEVITGRTVSLAEVTGEGKLVSAKGSTEPKVSNIYNYSPVIKLLG